MVVRIQPRVTCGDHRLPDEAGAQDPGPVRRRDRHGVEPGREREPFAATCGPSRGRTKCRFGPGKRLKRDGPTALRACTASGGKREPGAVPHEGRRQQLQPQAGAARDLLAAIPDEARDGRPILCPAVANERLRERATPLEQARGALVANSRLGLADLLDEHAIEVRAQDLVIPVRALALVDHHGEQLATGQFLQEQRAPPPVQQLVAQVAGQPDQDARVDEEPAQLIGELREDVPCQVLAQEPRAGPDPAEDPPALIGGLATRREMEQLQPGRPALGAPREHRKLGGRHRVAVEVAEEALHFPGSEAQVVALDLEQLAGDVQARQVEVRANSRRGKDPQPRRRIVHESAEHRFGGRALKGVQVVDDEDGLAAGPLLQRSRSILDVVPAHRQPRQHCAEGRFQMAEHPCRIVVPGLGAIPGHGQAGCRGEAGEQRGLAGAGRRDDERQPMALYRGGELRLQALARECRCRGGADLRRYDRGRLRTRRHRALGTITVPLIWQRQAPRRCPPVDGKVPYGATVIRAGSSLFRRAIGRLSAPGWRQV